MTPSHHICSASKDPCPGQVFTFVPGGEGARFYLVVGIGSDGNEGGGGEYGR